MNQHALILSLGLFCLTYSAILNASVCSTLIRTIDNDIDQSGDAIHTKRLPWMNVYWLKKRLGPPVLGKPETTSSNQAQLKYTWHCPENEEERLNVVVNDKGLVTEVKGLYTSEEKAEMFTASLPQNNLPTAPALLSSPPPPPPQKLDLPPSPPKEAPKPEIKQEEPLNPLAKLLNPYNESFQSSFKTKEEVAADMSDKMKSFYNNMRSCTPGIYRYAIYLQSGFVFPISTIAGKKNGLCNVDTVFTVPEMGEIKARCSYKLDRLAAYTDEEADALIKGKNFDKTNPSLRDKAEAESCVTYINGKRQPKIQ